MGRVGLCGSARRAGPETEPDDEEVPYAICIHFRLPAGTRCFLSGCCPPRPSQFFATGSVHGASRPRGLGVPSSRRPMWRAHRCARRGAAGRSCDRVTAHHGLLATRLRNGVSEPVYRAPPRPAPSRVQGAPSPVPTPDRDAGWPRAAHCEDAVAVLSPELSRGSPLVMGLDGTLAPTASNAMSARPARDAESPSRPSRPISTDAPPPLFVSLCLPRPGRVWESPAEPSFPILFHHL